MVAVDQPRAVRHLQRMDEKVMPSILRGAASSDLPTHEELHEVVVPTLVLAGTRDAVVPPARQRSLASGIAGARYATLEGAGHIGFLTHRAEVARHVQRFLRENSRSTC